MFFIVHDAHYISAMEEEELQVALAISASLTDQEVEIAECSRLAQYHVLLQWLVTEVEEATNS